MAFPTSGLFVPTFISGLDGTIVLDLNVSTHKVALYTNAMTGADLTGDTAYNVGAWATANEVASGGGYTTGGNLLVSPTFLHTTLGVVSWDATDPVWTTSTITARGALYYADGLAGNNAIVAQTFGADIASTGGSFTIVLAATGIFTIDLVP